MDEDVLIEHLAKTGATPEENNARMEALELAVGWLLRQQPGDSGLQFLTGQTQILAAGGKFPDVVAALEVLTDLVDS